MDLPEGPHLVEQSLKVRRRFGNNEVHPDSFSPDKDAFIFVQLRSCRCPPTIRGGTLQKPRQYSHQQKDRIELLLPLQILLLPLRFL